MTVVVECQKDAPAGLREEKKVQRRLGRAQKDAAGRAMTSEHTRFN
jgi:hypothetical protein